jgi:hypothetical protein
MRPTFQSLPALLFIGAAIAGQPLMNLMLR